MSGNFLPPDPKFDLSNSCRKRKGSDDSGALSHCRSSKVKKQLAYPEDPSERTKVGSDKAVCDVTVNDAPGTSNDISPPAPKFDPLSLNNRKRKGSDDSGALSHCRGSKVKKRLAYPEDPSERTKVESDKREHDVMVKDASSTANDFSPLAPKFDSSRRKPVKRAFEFLHMRSQCREVKARRQLESSFLAVAACEVSPNPASVLSESSSVIDSDGTFDTDTGSAAMNCLPDSGSDRVVESDQGISDSVIVCNSHENMDSCSVVDFSSLKFTDLISRTDDTDFYVDIFALMEMHDQNPEMRFDDQFDVTTLFACQSNLLTSQSALDRILNNFDDDSDFSDMEDDVSKNTFCGRVEVELRVWTLTEKEKHSKVTNLLKRLRKMPELSDLPATAASLVKTPKISTKDLEDVPGGGQYYHLGIAKSLKVILKREKSGHVKILVNVDGVSAYKSTGSEVWPILCRITSIKSVSHIIFPVGLYYNNTKPKRPDFLKSFTEEAQSLINEGLQINGQHFTISVHGFTCDAPAKAMVLGITACNGKVSCTRCHVCGKWSKTSHRVYFADDNEAARTHDESLSMSDEKYHKFETPVVKISTLIFPTSIAIDYMHCIPLGTFRTMVYLWMLGKVPHKLGAFQRRKIAARLQSLKKFSPKEFNRKPRTLVECPYFKATEWRSLLLHTGIVIFRKYLPSDKYDNFLYLSIAVRIILDSQYNKNEAMISYARSLLLYFIDTFRNLYGEDFITHNFHQLIHICDDLSYFENLEDSSCFKFENFMQFLLILIRKSSHVLVQLARRLEEMHEEEVLYDQVAPVYFEEAQYFMQHVGGPLVNGASDPQYKVLKLYYFELTTDQPDNCCTLKGNKVVLISNICMDSVTQKMVILCKYFTVMDNLFTHPCQSSKLGIHAVSKLSDRLKSWPVESILHKNFLIPIKNGWAAVPLLKH